MLLTTHGSNKELYAVRLSSNRRDFIMASIRFSTVK